MAIRIRTAEEHDIAAMAAIRAQEWETAEFWETRIPLYLSGEHSPRQALAARAAFVAVDDKGVIGFVAGHRTRRHECDGELQWINVDADGRRSGVASRLMEAMAKWFVEQQAFRVCVNVDPKNTAARSFYAKHGARDLKQHWMVWEDVRQA